MASNVDNVSYADTSPGLPGFVLTLSYNVATLVALYLAGVNASNASMSAGAFFLARCML